MLEVKDLAIVILNWNGKELLEQFLPSVINYSNTAQIYVADNNSSDNSVAFISENFPSIKLIQNPKNGGYAKGYNDALKSIEEPLICLLNSDVEVTENWLKPILSEFNTNTKTAIIQPKILDYNNKLFFEYAGAAGGYIDKYAYPFCRGRIFETIERDQGQYDDYTHIFWASGACFFIRNSVFKVLNGFDESFFAHMEEIDMCWRAFNINYHTKYIGASVIYHVGGATLNNSNPKKTYLNFRNSLFTLVKNTDSNLLTRVFIRLILDGIAAIRFLIKLKPKYFLAIIKAHFSFYVNLGRLIEQRKQLPKRSDYFEKNSIVWSYFIRKQTKF